jgi:hypothetical protein
MNVERLLHRLGIVAKKKAREWVALCPNPEHADQSPSWRIRDEPGSKRHGMHHCWPCGFGGTATDLVMSLKGISDYRDAKRWIEEEVGIVVDAPVAEEVHVAIKVPRLRFQLPAGVVVNPLEKWPGPARDYFLSRGLEDWQAERWGVGYSVEGRCKGRIVFISRDACGRPMRYTARSFTNQMKRYLEPEPHEGANQSIMFGEQHWPDLEDRKEAIVFQLEGAVNGLALEAELPGVYFAATAGSEIRPLYTTKLASWGCVVLMGDDDSAGEKLSTKLGIELARHTRTERLNLGMGKLDAADLRRLRPGELGSIVRSWLGGARR